MAAITVGFDVGGQKTMIVADDADIVLTDTGSIFRPTLVAFSGNSRLIGEEAAPEIGGESTVTTFNLLVGKAEEKFANVDAHRRLKQTVAENGTNTVSVSYNGQEETFSLTAVLGMFLAKQIERVRAVYPSQILNIAFALPTGYDESYARAYSEACQVAGIDLSQVFFTANVDCLVATYARKLHALRGPEKTALEGKNAVIVEMGHTHTTVVVVHVASLDGDAHPTVLGVASDDNLGALQFDLKLFDHFAGMCAKKDGTVVTPGTKRGYRLLSGCERIRKLLSQLADAKVTVENLTDSGDVEFALRRDDMHQITGDLLARFQALIQQAVDASAAAGSFGKVSAVEIVGGGSRMPAVQHIITQIFGSDLPLGAKLDDSSVALGSALVVNRHNSTAFALAAAALASSLPTPPVASEGGENTPIPASEQAVAPGSSLRGIEPVVRRAAEIGSVSFGLTAEELIAAKSREIALQALDAQLVELNAARNDMESYILEMRSAKRRKHGEKIDATALEQVLNENETWMWDFPDASLNEVKEKNLSLRTRVTEICADYLAATESDRVAVESALEAEARAADAERQAAGEDEDHDNRKLRKPDRMRLVVKNKEEGTELFKGGNFRPAAARYHKALTHCAKFFDLSPEDIIEVKGIKATLYLNLTSCYLKLENWDQAMRNVNDALELEPNNPKAYFRRSIIYEAKKDWEKALVDIKKCQELNTVEDKVVTKASERIKKEIQREKDKEKKMWGKAFS